MNCDIGKQVMELYSSIQQNDLGRTIIEESRKRAEFESQMNSSGVYSEILEENLHE